MRVAIAGASGFIGSALTSHLSSAGHDVVALVRPNSSSAEAGGDNRIGWDPAAGILEPADLVGCDAVVNLAGPGIADRRWSPEYRRLLRDARVDSTALIAEALAALANDNVAGRPTTLINGSAIGYYGSRGDEELTESSKPGTGFLPDLCTRWEAATTPAAEAGVTVSIVRTGIVLHPGGGALGKMLRPFRWGLGGRFGSGQQWMSWISMRDEVGAIAHLLNNPTTGVFNLTAPNPVRNRDFTTMLGRTLRRPTFLPVPAFGPRLVLGRELADALLFDSQRILPQALTGTGYEYADPFLADAFSSMLASEH